MHKAKKATALPAKIRSFIGRQYAMRPGTRLIKNPPKAVKKTLRLELASVHYRWTTDYADHPGTEMSPQNTRNTQKGKLGLIMND